MRKQTKLAVVLSTAALLAIGASMTSFAATGWVEQNGAWVYYDKDGYQVTESWKKSVDTWFYLDSDGTMATDSVIDDGDNTYYVDENGAMASNKWVKVENLDYTGSGDDDEYNWYYFQANGKAYKAGDSTSFKTVNGKKYAFDTDGKMLYGWVDGNSQMSKDDDAWTTAEYYCGTQDDGAQLLGWKQLHVIDTTNADGEDQDYWFYFKTNGKKLGLDGETTKTINGKKYIFESSGRMLSEWVSGQSSESAVKKTTASSYRYYSSKADGSRAKGWFKVVPDETVNKTDYDDDANKWFYAKNDGTLYNSCIKTINGKKYAFNDRGEMLVGLWALKLDANGSIDTYTELDSEVKINEYSDGTKVTVNGAEDVYFFGTDDDGAMKLGNQNVTVDGDTYAYYFGKTGSNKGMGFGSNYASNSTQTVVTTAAGTDKPVTTYIYDKNAIYVHGKKAKADSDLKYQAFTAMGKKVQAPVATGYAEEFLVNASGSLMKNKKNVKDANDNYYSTDKAGQIIYFGSKKQ